jgi:chromosome segregation protein
MKIEKLELTGFKSFAEKTTFTFHPGITCFVGPNGCGKSNIVDAFRWVLGEQSAKTLRGDRMEEVIFNGSETKKPRGMSEVVLYITFPEEGNGQDGEKGITVSRCLYRSGESEYLINRQICRLKDVRDMFLDTGLEMKSYSVIEQGKIGEIINAKPQDRRFLIEEIAGVMKYKVRKAEAKNKLDSSRLNLQRIEDILSEVKRQLNAINRQVKKAERYKRYSDSLKEVDLRIAKREHLRMKTEREELTGTLMVLTDDEAKRRSEITELENSLQQKKLHILEKEKEVDAIVEQLQGKEKNISDLERQKALHTSDIEHLITNIESLRTQSEEVDALVLKKKERLDEISGTDSHLQSMINSLKDTLLYHETDLASSENEISSLEEDIDEKRKTLFKVTDSLGSLRNELNRLEATREGHLKRVSISQRESEEAQRRIGELVSQLEDMTEERASRENALKELFDRRSSCHEDLKRSTAELEDLKLRKSNLREEIASLDSRIQSLNELISGNIDRNSVRKIGVQLIASFSEIIDVDSQYEKAIEAALSDKIKGFIVSSKDDIRKSVEMVNEQNLPRTAFMLQEIPVRSGISPEATPLQGINPLHDFVRCEDAYSSLVQSLLSDYLLTETLESAFRVLEEENDLPSHIRFVTLNGEVVEPGGVVLCGSGSNVLILRRQGKELSSSVEEKRRTLSQVEEDLAKCDRKIEELKDLLKNVDSEIVLQEKDLSLLRASERTYDEEKERFEKKYDFLLLELEELQREITSIEKDLDDRKATIKVEDEQKASLESELHSLQENLFQRRISIDSKRNALTDMKVELNSYSERLKAIATEREALEKDTEELEQREEFLIDETDRHATLVEEKKTETVVLENQLKETVTVADQLKQEISRRKDAILEEREKIQVDEDLIKKDRSALELVNKDVHEKEMLLTELSLKMSNLVEGTKEKYSLDIGDADIMLTDTPEDDLENAAELREKIQSMGPVNIGALDEHRDLSERHEFLRNQHDDIVQSINELEDAIGKINRTTRKRLKEAFETLNVKFNEVFQLLFDGGTAELRLTDENNILESGIDIVVQPPGKRLQNLNLLSGGEKALAALGLLFAGFLLKPTPLCILDEADAPLDESNTERFRTMLKNLSKEIQFIVITHNRITMEGSDYLYGITMEEPGVSKVLSMEFV